MQMQIIMLVAAVGSKKLKNLVFMGCPALGIWVGFLKQPDALPGRAPQKMMHCLAERPKKIKMIYF
jgi:hypothetical protein